MFPRGNIKISNVLKFPPRLRGVPLGLRYQGISSYINLSVFFIKAEWLGLGSKIYRRIFASHSSIRSLRLQQKQARPTCNDNNNINICLQFFYVEAIAQWENRALIDLRVAGSNLAGQLLIYFHNVFPVLTKTLCRHASLAPRSGIKAFVRKPRRCSPWPSPPPPPWLTKCKQI